MKKRGGWVCECDWDGWFLCFESDSDVKNVNVPVERHPDRDGVYRVRVISDGDSYETESEFSVVEKNWGEYTNQAVSCWKIEYDDHWMGFRGVYAWKLNG